LIWFVLLCCDITSGCDFTSGVNTDGEGPDSTQAHSVYRCTHKGTHTHTHTHTHTKVHTHAHIHTQSMEEETSGLKQILQGMANSVKADDDALADFREVSFKGYIQNIFQHMIP